MYIPIYVTYEHVDIIVYTHICPFQESRSISSTPKQRKHNIIMQQTQLSNDTWRLKTYYLGIFFVIKVEDQLLEHTTFFVMLNFILHCLLKFFLISTDTLSHKNIWEALYYDASKINHYIKTQALKKNSFNTMCTFITKTS